MGASPFDTFEDGRAQGRSEGIDEALAEIEAWISKYPEYSHILVGLRKAITRRG
jgi:hypothetical protein